MPRALSVWRSSRWSLPILIVALGLFFRTYHYLRNPSVWHDEASLIVNVLGKSYAELLGPLVLACATPPLFLWTEHTSALLLGDSSFALRLVPYLTSCLALILLAPIAYRLLSPPAACWALFLFACSEQLAWHACEAKPYSTDALIGVLLLAAYVFTTHWPLSRRLVLFAAAAPPFLCLSYPACFLYLGVCAALAPAIFRERRRPAVRLASALLVGALLAPMIWLVLGPIPMQRSAAIGCWEDKFPSWQHPWTIPLWSMSSWLDVFRYCYKPVGQPLVLVAVIGVAALWRAGRRGTATFLLVPILTAFAAAWVRAYPFGGARIIIYAAPALTLLVGAGVPVVFRGCWSRSRLAGVVVLAVLVLPLCNSIRRVAAPWDRPAAAQAATYVLEHCRDGDAIEGNSWEFVYYFRNQGAAFRESSQYLGPYPGMCLQPTDSGRCIVRDDVPCQHADRVWLVFSSEEDTAEEEVSALRAALAPDWKITEEQEFRKVWVFRIEPLRERDPALRS